MRRSIVVVLLLAFCFVAASVNFAAEKAAKPAPAPSTEMPSDLPPPSLTLGAHGGDGVFEGFGDILAPVYLTKSGLWFVNPRLSITDDDEEELNVGLGYRHLFAEKSLILGGNVYYDSRWTRDDNHFSQLGLGAEALTEWVDARANYYLPEDNEELADTHTETDVQVSSSSHTYWRDPYAVENQIDQRGTRVTRTRTTTTTYLFEMYEQAREGWDAEIGVKLPGLDKLADVKLFGGYYSWDAEYAGQDKVEGFKGRVEVRAFPAVYLDASVYEDAELFGSDWLVGGRLNMPFEVDKMSKGKNPFEGAFAKAKPGFANRLLDMVMRDLHVRTELSPWEENVEARQVDVQTRTRKKSLHETLMDDIIFVDGDEGNDANPGTAEDPKETIQNGVDSAFGDRNVYVYGGEYRENVVMDNADSDIQVYGEGCPIRGNGGKDFGGGNYPVVNGSTAVGHMPAFRLVDADNVAIRGFDITHDDGLAIVVNDGVFGTYSINFVGVEAENADNLYLGCNRIHDNTFGALILANNADGTEDYFLQLQKNEIFGNNDDGVRVDVVGGSGTFALMSQGNDYSGNVEDGIDVNAADFDSVFLMFQNDRANDSLNADGFDFGDVDNNEFVALAMRNIEANRNDDDGITADQMDNSLAAQGTFMGMFDGIRASDNGGDGFDLNVLGNAGPAITVIADGRFNNNGDEGIDMDLVSQNFALAAIGPDGAIFKAIEMFLPFFGSDIRGSGLVVADGNANDGIEVDITAPNAALAAFLDVQANNNGWIDADGDGIDVELTANNGIAGAIFIPSAQLMGLVQGGVDIVTALLGFPSIDLPGAGYHGPIEAIGNQDSGIDVAATGFTAAFGAFFDIDAWLNGTDGITAVLDCQLDPANGTAIGIFGGVDAWANAADGINAEVLGRSFALGAFVDIWADENTSDGLRANIHTLDGTAIGLMASTRLVDDLLNLVGLPFDLGMRNGPNTFNDNGINGLEMDVQGQNLTLALLADIQANENWNRGLDLVFDGNAGDTIGLLYGVDALRNDGSGIAADVNAGDLAILGLLDFRANDNASFGLDCTVDSINGTAIALAGSSRLLVDLLGGLGLGGLGGGRGPNQANRNTNTGISLDVNGDTAVGILLDTVANDNGNFGFDVDLTGDNGDAIGAMWRVDALRNASSGIYLSLTGDDDVYGVLADFRANDNGNFGVYADLSAVSGSAYGILGTTEFIDWGLSTLGTPFSLADAGIRTFGPNEANRNANIGVYMDIDAVDQTVAGVLDTVASDNANHGVYIDADTTAGDLYAAVAQVRADRNGNVGIYADLDCSADMVGIFYDVLARDNVGDGVNASLTAGDGVYGVFMDMSANGNGGRGYYLSLSGVNEAIGAFTALEAEGNGIDGLYVDADTTAAGSRIALYMGPDAFADFAGLMDALGYVTLPPELIALAPRGGIHARYNGGDGVYVDAQAPGLGSGVAIYMDKTKSKFNGQHGVAINANAGNDVNVYLTRSRASENTFDGFRLGLAAGTAVNVFAEDNATRFNGGDGVWLSAAAPVLNLDFGGGIMGSAGGNVISDNGGLGLNNAAVGAVDAEGNWWGGNAPVFGVDYGAGVNAPATWLAVKP